ncbi:TNT domain-containing protein [Streptomyces sp. NBC_01190]|uniref:TNT domain-containing protein n=1 Tax=Streptomyces sp. NBC_01190 TaxID=2903767 RepID=UPI003862D5D6|nr:TNT domain-containing protein [Streptomyces sp. NBC_01190]
MSAALALTAGLAGSLLVGTPTSSAVAAGASASDRLSTTATAPVSTSAGVRPKDAKDTKDAKAPQDTTVAVGIKDGGRDDSRCLGLVPSPYPFAQTSFVCNDWRFGPAVLPHTGILGGILDGYDRFGPGTPVEFLNHYWDPAADLGRGNWKFPSDDGFSHDTTGQAIAAPLTLHPGELLDRFGNEFGSFLAPAGAKYGARSIPPSNLNTEDPRYPYNYHLFRVKTDTVVCAGPVAPFFDQPGQGVQYVTSVTPGSSYCPTVQTGKTVSSLVRSGNLERAN